MRLSVCNALKRFSPEPLRGAFRMSFTVAATPAVSAVLSTFPEPAVRADDALADLPLIAADAIPPRIAAALQALRDGRAVVLQDDHDRENEADLIVAAERLST